jgi:glycoside/pentoside/hexuronide:cation symporter, GPH family
MYVSLAYGRCGRGNFASEGFVSKPISIWQEAAYGSPYLVKALAMTPLLAFIPSFYAKDFGLPLQLVGLILFATRITDVITDPLIGTWSDRTRSRFGRRKPFMLLGMPLLMLSAWMVFAPPVPVTPWYALIWLSLIYLGFTFMDIPHRAWGADLVSSYDGRTRIVAFREAAGMGSSLLALLIILVAPTIGMGATADTLRIMAVLFVVGLPLLYGLALFATPEPAPDHLSTAPVPFRETVAAIVENRPFLWLLGGLTVLMGGAIIGASLHLIVMESYFGIRQLFPVILAGETIAGLVSAPFWVWLSRRIGKHRALAIGTMAMGVLSLPIPLLGPDTWQIYAACIVTRGFAGGALAILVASMLADVTDLDLERTGRSRRGLFAAMISMVGKTGAALGVFVGTALPPLFGFQPSNPTNSPEALRALIIVYAWVPAVVMAASSFFFWRYPLTRARQQEVRARLDARAAAADRSV